MGSIIDAGDQKAQDNGHRREAAGTPEQPAKLARVECLPLAPEENQQCAIQTENSARGPAGHCLPLMGDEREQIADQPAGKINRRTACGTVHPFDQLAAIPQRPHIHQQMQGAEMQKQRATKPPPLTILRRRAEICPPGQLYLV